VRPRRKTGTGAASSTPRTPRPKAPSAEEACAIKRVWGEALGTDALKVNPPPGLDEFELSPRRRVGYRPCRHSGDMHDAGTSSREAS